VFRQAWINLAQDMDKWCFYYHGDEPSVYIKDGEFLANLSDS